MSENMSGLVPPAEIKPVGEDMRERVTKLGEEAVIDIAEAENRFRSGVMTPDEASDLVLQKIEAEQARGEAEREGRRDKLTGLRNKNAYLDEVPDYFVAEHRRYQHFKTKDSVERRKETVKDVPHCSFLIVDIDYFKRVNDEHGHAAGDQALKQVAEIIRKMVRTSDIPYRFGGEEFVVFLPDTPSKSAYTLAERIREEIEKTPLQVTDNSGASIPLNKTVSIGCISTDQLDLWDQLKEDEAKDFLEEMMKNADTALYQAKEGGRNQVVLYTPKSQPQFGE